MRLWALVMVGCTEIGVSPVGPPPASVRVPVTDAFVQAPLPAVDLLVVVDDTPSMAQELDALNGAFAGLIDGLDRADVRWQVGVVAADATGERAGWLRGRPFVLTPSTVDAPVAFAAAVGSVSPGGQERGFDAAMLALDLAGEGGPNRAFRRPDAALHVLFVSDDDDASTVGVDGVIGRLAAESVAGTPARVSAIVGDLPGGCASVDGGARPAPRYLDAVARTGGVAASICAADFAPLLASLSAASLVLPAEFPLSRAPDDAGVRVEVNGARVEAGVRLALDPPRVVFDAPPPSDARVTVRYTVTLGEDA